MKTATMLPALKCDFRFDYGNFVEGISYKSGLKCFSRDSKMTDKAEITADWLLDIRYVQL
jgi:hypothetical protein